MRAVSTVLDVSLFLLLVGAAAATLVMVPHEVPPAEGDPADETVELLATSTAQVQYTIEPGLDHERARADGERALDPYHRTTQDSVANLLGVAAVSTAELDGERLMGHGVAFERRVQNVTESRITRENVSTAVHTRWEPYPDAPLSGTVTAGERPPPAVDVHAATVTVDSGMANVSAEAHRAADNRGYAGVATVLADATIEGYLPFDEIRMAAYGGYPSDDLLQARFEGMEHALEPDSPNYDDGDGTEALETLEDALADRYEADLRERYDDPAAAAADVDVDRATVTVRTWSR